MKRALLFGLVCAAAGASYILYSWSWLIRDDYLFNAFVACIAAWALILAYLAVLSTGLGVAGMSRSLYRKLVTDSGRLRYLLRIAVAAGTGYLGWSLLHIGYTAFPAESYQLLQDSFAGTHDLVVREAVFSLPGVFAAFSSGVLIYAVLASGSLREFIRKASPCVAGSVLAVASFVSIQHAAERLDLGKYLDDIPGISSETRHRVLITLDEPAITVPLCDYFSDCISNSFCRDLPLTKHNARVIEGYLEDTGYSTALRGPGLSFLADERLNELDTAGATRYLKKGYSITHDELDLLFLIKRLDSGPATEPYRRVLDELGNNADDMPSATDSLMLSRSYAKFGELERARILFEQVHDLPDYYDAKSLARFRVPDTPPFYKGSINGIIVLYGKAADGISIGIINSRFIRGARARAAGELGGNFVPYLDFNALKDGRKTAPDGSFEFTGLGEGEYVLLLSLLDVDGKTYRVVNSPGVIAISKDNPHADVGEVRLVIE